MSMNLILKQKCILCESTADLYGSNCKHMTLCLTCSKFMAERAYKCLDCGVLLSHLLRGDKNEEANEDGGGLIKSRKEFKNLQLGRAGGLNDDAEDGDMDVDMDPTPKQRVLSEEEAAENRPLIPVSSGFTEGTPSTSKSAKGKRKMDVDAKPSKLGVEPKSSVKEQRWASSKRSAPSKSTSKCSANAGAITEEEIKAFLVRKQRVTTQVLIAKFRARLKTTEDKNSFAGILRRISKIEKSNGASHIVLRERERGASLTQLQLELSSLCLKTREGDENEEAEEDGGGLIKSGKEFKKLQLGHAGGLDDDAEDGDMDDDMDPTPKEKVLPEEEAAENSPLKPVSSGFTEGTPSSSKSAKGKRTMDVNDAKPSKPGLVTKNQEPKSSVKEQSRASSKSRVHSKSTSKCCSNAGAVTEEEIREILVRKQCVTMVALVAKFKARLKTREEKTAFAGILRRICKIQKSTGGNYVVLRERERDTQLELSILCLETREMKM